jgi:hypothetical protein
MNCQSPVAPTRDTALAFRADSTTAKYFRSAGRPCFFQFFLEKREICEAAPEHYAGFFGLQLEVGAHIALHDTVRFEFQTAAQFAEALPKFRFGWQGIAAFGK